VLILSGFRKVKFFLLRTLLRLFSCVIDYNSISYLLRPPGMYSTGLNYVPNLRRER